MLTIQGRELSVLADTAGLRYTIRLCCGAEWTMTARPYIETGRRGRLYFDEAQLLSETLIDTGVCHGVEALLFRTCPYTGIYASRSKTIPDAIRIG